MVMALGQAQSLFLLVPVNKFVFIDLPASSFTITLASFQHSEENSVENLKFWSYTFLLWEKQGYKKQELRKKWIRSEPRDRKTIYQYQWVVKLFTLEPAAGKVSDLWLTQGLDDVILCVPSNYRGHHQQYLSHLLISLCSIFLWKAKAFFPVNEY